MDEYNVVISHRVKMSFFVKYIIKSRYLEFLDKMGDLN